MKKKMISKTLVGKTAVKALLGVALLTGSVVAQTGAVSAAEAKPTAKPTAQSTAAPVMRDNLSKYGLVKDMELPVTVTAGGLSYTLEKIMIYDINSKDAQNLIKQFRYDSFGVLVSKPKYFIWTKITIKNNSNSTVKRSLNDQQDKWVLTLKRGGELDPIWPKTNEGKINNKSAFYYYTLKPGEELSTYQAFLYEKDFDYFAVRLYHANGFDEKLIVKY
ncbi:hypothetical protein HQN87_27510 [Paenibacillus tritici]|uniref:DUF4352 domain-containing protein n=1 Tax=Paenibacillus tritici TaxID=1873425 RepID=A0ABX2DWH8_9BACL|nr:hypothetical protein [Paenibacillus tritici]NQX49078.1 hypothetical protein [Paenibacillus tritici]